MSVAVGTETAERRSPSPERRSPSPQRRRSSSVDQSEVDSLSSASTATDTVNDNVSEGQWLVSRSEGQVAGLPLDEGTISPSLPLFLPPYLNFGGWHYECVTVAKNS